MINTGCPSIDIASEILHSPRIDFDPYLKYKGVGSHINYSQDYIVVLQHPVTTEYGASKEQITKTLHAINKLKFPTFWFWPNVDAGSDGTSSGIRVFEKNITLGTYIFSKIWILMIF